MSRPRRTALFVLVWFALLAWLPRSSARENESFGIEPYPEQAGGSLRGTFSIPLEPGATFEDAVRIYNRTEQTLELAVYAADAEAAPNETDISVGFRNEDPKGVGSWIDLARDTVELAPRDEVIITFRVEVATSEPKPSEGAIVVENTARGLAENASKREFLTVLTVPPNTQTASVRVRPLLLRSPWIVVAMLGLVVVGAVIWIGTRRARRPKDVLVPAGEIDQPELEPEDAPEASRPVIRRLGASEPEAAAASTNVIERPRRQKGDERPLIEDAFVVEVDIPEDETDEEGELGVDVDAPEDEDPDEYDLAEEEEEEEEEEEDEEDLPPARPRPRRRTQPTKKAKASPKKQARPAAKKKPAPRKQTTKRASTARKTSAKPKPPKTERGYIPLKDL
jgi:chemotaxis protein histidine kinase CheA